MRHKHYLKKTKGSAQPRVCIALECASRDVPIDGRPDAVCEVLTAWSLVRWDRQGKHAHQHVLASGETGEQLWDYLALAGRGGGLIWVFGLHVARCLGLLDFWGRLEAGEITLCGEDYRDATGKLRQGAGYCVLEDPPTVILARIRGSCATLKIVDVRNYGIDSYTPILTFEGGRPVSDSPCPSGVSEGIEWSSLRAVKLAGWIEWLIEELEERKLGSLQATAGSQATYSWRYKHLSHPVWVHTCLPALQLERDALYGGRNECFRLGRVDGPIYHLDYRGFYPSICAEEELPTLFEYYWENLTREQGEFQTAGWFCIADVTLETTTADYPWRSPQGEIIYPIGRFRTALASPELRHAAGMGRVVTYHRLARYASYPAFAGYARECIDLRERCRKAGNQAGLAWSKALGVSLWGKLAQTGRRWVDCPGKVLGGPYAVEYGQHDGHQCRYRSIAWHTQREEISSESAESCPALAATVTSAGRARLGSALAAAGAASRLYCDTDSVFVDSEGMESLRRVGLVGDDLPGRLRLFHTYTYIVINGLKHYETPDGLVCAGMPRGQRSEGPEPDLYWWAQGIAEAIQSRRQPAPERVLRSYHRAPGYTYGVVRESGRIDPLEIHE